MPEYLAPGVYVEEVGHRAKTIEGVEAGVAGFVGPTLSGRVGGRLKPLASFADFERVYGGLAPLVFGGRARPNFVAHAARAFFDNGGRRLYVSRVRGRGGAPPAPADYRGGRSGATRTGLAAFEDVEEISVVAAPGSSYRSGQAGAGDDGRAGKIAAHLIAHAEKMRYRVAVLDSPDRLGTEEVLGFRRKFDSTHAALYYPWVTVSDPSDRKGVRKMNLPPSGFVAGIYARSDAERGVFKAPANEVVRGAVGFESLVTKAQQDVLDPEGVNCFRSFAGRGHLLWGARTVSSDPEWKYVSIRRYFAYLEQSIDKGTEWVVFENNDEPLWACVRRAVEEFLRREWLNGGLLGSKPEQAFFVRCDRSTMTQNDLDNGRLVCLVGVAPVKPAEFVLFRIGQWTADRKD